MRGLTLITPPAAETLSLKQVKRHLRVDISDDDSYITDLMVDARDEIESEAGLALMTQTWEQVYDMFPYWSDPFTLLRWPVQSITSIKYVDAASNIITMDPATYVANFSSIPPRVAPTYARYWPVLALQSLANVTIRFVAGWDDVKKVPPRLNRAQLMLIGHWYENREDVMTGPRAVSIQVERSINQILQPFKGPMVA